MQTNCGVPYILQYPIEIHGRELFIYCKCSSTVVNQSTGRHVPLLQQQPPSVPLSSRRDLAAQGCLVLRDGHHEVVEHLARQAHHRSFINELTSERPPTAEAQTGDGGTLGTSGACFRNRFTLEKNTKPQKGGFVSEVMSKRERKAEHEQRTEERSRNVENVRNVLSN